MVGYLMLLKMFHCNRKLYRKIKKSSNITPKKSHKIQSPVVKNEIKDPEEQIICRVCMKEGDVPIYGNGIEDLSETLSTFGGINVSSMDDFPKFLCHSCHEFLQAAILFRKTAQESDETLRQSSNYNILHSDKTTNDSPQRYHISRLDDSMDNPQDDSSDYDEITEEASFSCKKCGISFKSFTELSEHRLSSEHENVRRKCPVCNKLYTAEYLKKHMLLHKMDREFMCDICGKHFPLLAPFKRHRVTHFYHLPFECTLCPYKGRFRESLKMHMRSHTGEKPYQCSHCPSRFVNASNLNKHMLTHQRNLNFKCESCGKGFYTKRALGLHFKVDHTGIKEHICNVCGKAFGYRKQMMKHQLIVHKREKLRSGRMPLYLQVESRNTIITE